MKGGFDPTGVGPQKTQRLFLQSAVRTCMHATGTIDVRELKAAFRALGFNVRTQSWCN